MLPYSGRSHAPPVPGAPALVVESIDAAHPGAEQLALSNVSLRVASGSRVALIGPNGSGKSTLLKAVAGLLPVQRGSIRVYGQPRGACHHRVAYLPQRGEIDWRFPINVRRLVVTGRYVHLGWLRRPRPHDWAMVDAALERLGLSDLATRQIGQLSGGQQQRALLARALVQEGDLIMLDEPLNAVDVATREIISRVLDDLRREGRTVIIATHDIEHLEAAYDTVIALYDGKINLAWRGKSVGVFR